MKGKRKPPKIPGVLRHIVGNNVRQLMEVRFHLQGDKVRALAAKSGIGKTSIDRIIKGQTGVNIDYIEDLAEALDVSSYQLLIPDLDARNPQIVNGATEAERQLYRRYYKKQLTGKVEV